MARNQQIAGLQENIELGLDSLSVRRYNPYVMIGKNNIDAILTALDRQIEAHEGVPVSIVVCGESALSSLQEDLFALNPSEEEMEMAVRWVLTQDVSEEFRMITRDFLRKKGFDEIAERI